MSLFDLTGKTALVTGARSGIGQGIALAFADHGADIVGLGSQAMPDMVKLVQTRGRKFKAIACDLEKRQDLNSIVEDAAALTGRIDILVNNAGRIRSPAKTAVAPFSFLVAKPAIRPIMLDGKTNMARDERNESVPPIVTARKRREKDR